MKLFVTLLLVLCFTASAQAQEPPPAEGVKPAETTPQKPEKSMGDGVKNEAKSPEEKPATVAEPTAPYDVKLLRLAEVLGSIHYLRALCEAGEGSKWRDTMNALIKAEKPGPKRKARLIARFNRGYRAFDSVYSSCTESALFAADRYRKEGVMLSSQITNRYGR